MRHLSLSASWNCCEPPGGTVCGPVATSTPCYGCNANLEPPCFQGFEDRAEFERSLPNLQALRPLIPWLGRCPSFNDCLAPGNYPNSEDLAAYRAPHPYALQLRFRDLLINADTTSRHFLNQLAARIACLSSLAKPALTAFKPMREDPRQAWMRPGLKVSLPWRRVRKLCKPRMNMQHLDTPTCWDFAVDIQTGHVQWMVQNVDFQQFLFSVDK